MHIPTDIVVMAGLTMTGLAAVVAMQHHIIQTQQKSDDVNWKVADLAAKQAAKNGLAIVRLAKAIEKQTREFARFVGVEAPPTERDEYDS